MTDFVGVLHDQAGSFSASQCLGITASRDYCGEQQFGLETMVVFQGQEPRVELNMTDK